MDKDNSNYVQSWILIGILIYTVLILLVVIIRQSVIKKKCCPFCNCSCCKSTQSPSNNFSCCHKNESLNETSCLQFPSCKCRCFRPDCSYYRCLCCEIVCESNVDGKYADSNFDTIP